MEGRRLDSKTESTQCVVVAQMLYSKVRIPGTEQVDDAVVWTERTRLTSKTFPRMWCGCCDDDAGVVAERTVEGRSSSRGPPAQRANGLHCWREVPSHAPVQ